MLLLLLLLKAWGTSWSRYSRDMPGLGWCVCAVLSGCWWRARRIWTGALLGSLGSDPISLGGVDGAMSVDGNGWHSGGGLLGIGKILNNSDDLAVSAGC